MTDASAGITAFVVGCERSGTTLLRAVLDAHPLVGVPPESYVTVPLLRNRDSFETSAGIDVHRTLEFLAQSASFGEWRLDLDELRLAWEAEPPATTPDALRRVYHAWAAAHGKVLAVDKTPFHVRTIELLATAFPEAVVVHLVRDGRDVADSLLRAPFGPRTFPAAVEHWRRSVERGLQQGAALGARCLVVRYEDLLADPPHVIDQVCAHLGIAPDAAMLHPELHADELLAPMQAPGHRDGIAAPIGATGRRWQEHLAPWRVEYFEAATRPLTAELGYALTREHDRPVARTAVAVAAGSLRATEKLVGVRKRLGAAVGRRPIQRITR